MSCEGECDVRGWHYEMDVNNPRMYGTCWNCGDILCHVLPPKKTYGDLELGEWSYERIHEKALRDQPLRQTIWHASQDPIRLQPGILAQIESRLLTKVFQRLDDWERRQEYRIKELEIEQSKLERYVTSDGEQVVEKLTELTWRLEKIIKEAESSIYRALQHSRFQHPLPENPDSPLPIICDSRDYTPQPSIYGLVARNDVERIRYVGQTLTPGFRFSNHLSKSAAPRVQRWIAEQGEGGTLMVLIETPHRLELDGREQYWIRYYRERGMADLNTNIRLSA
jgi:hypothetical protein